MYPLRYTFTGIDFFEMRGMSHWLVRYRKQYYKSQACAWATLFKLTFDERTRRQSGLTKTVLCSGRLLLLLLLLLLSIMPILVPWERLIRFVAEEDNQVYYGEPITSNDGFDLGELKETDDLKARVIEGSNPLDPSRCTITSTILSVRQILGPLTPEMVPAVRCIGGNYKSHCKCPNNACRLVIRVPADRILLYQTSGRAGNATSKVPHHVY